MLLQIGNGGALMPGSIVTKQLNVEGMTCGGCELKLEKKIKAIKGVEKVKASYSSGTIAVTYNESNVKLNEIKNIITALHYEVKGEKSTSDYKTNKYFEVAIIGVIVLGIFFLLNKLGITQIFNEFPEAKQGMSYAALFVIGLLTSVHCVGMCGGICLSQCVNTKGEGIAEQVRPSLLYNLGRVISYTVIGGLVGALGSVISLGGMFRGAVALFAGVFMVIMGLNMLNLFPWIKKLTIRMPKFIVANAQGKNNNPFYIGLLNGFMPCGPLQAMQLYALSTGDPLRGGLSMFFFSVGTMPVMFGFGSLSAFISKKFTAKVMTASAVLVIILGLGMFNTGLSMSGFLGIGTEQSAASDFEPVMQDGYQIVTVEVAPRAYAPITVKKGIPVKLNFHAEEKNLNGCNYAVFIPKYEIQQVLSPGDNVVEFTPSEAEVIPYSCWMNMIRSSITVVD